MPNGPISARPLQNLLLLLEGLYGLRGELYGGHRPGKFLRGGSDADKQLRSDSFSLGTGVLPNLRGGVSVIGL